MEDGYGVDGAGAQALGLQRAGRFSQSPLFIRMIIGCNRRIPGAAPACSVCTIAACHLRLKKYTTMHQTPSLAPWLDHLHALLPPQTVTVVGAGNGGDTWVQWLAAHPLAHATLVEAHALPFAALQRLQDAGQLPHATLLHAVVADGDGEASFFTASLTAESGLLPPESLRPLWPGIHTVSEQSQPTIALGTLLSATTQQHGGPQWLLLDCLPAAALLRSAQAQLPQVDVVLARVLCAADHAPTLCGMGAGLEDVANALPGFQLLALQPSRHPALGHALFVRDYRRAAQHASQARDAEAQAKQAAQQAQASLQAQLLQAHAENAELLKKQELQAQAQQALQADLTKTIQACDAEAQAQQAAQQALAELQQRLEQAQAEHQATAQRQQLLQDELLKAEAQLELIKELLLMRGDLAPDGITPAA